MQPNLKKRLVTDIFSIPAFASRIVRSKVTKVVLADIEANLTPLHFEIIGLLIEKGDLPVVEIGKRLVLAKAHMTQLLDKLVIERMVVRESDPSDRRVIRIKVTEKGIEYFERFRESGGYAMEQAISTLDENDLKDLSESLGKVREILAKMI